MTTILPPVVIFSLNKKANSWRVAAAPWFSKYEIWASAANADLMALTTPQAVAFLVHFGPQIQQLDGAAIGVQDLIPNRPVWYTSPAAVEAFLRGYPASPTKAAARKYITQAAK
jgi:hypothetical protein